MNYIFENHPDPGLAVDTVKILIHKLNAEHIWLQSQLLPATYHQDEAYVKHQLNLFQAPDSKLYLFVYISKTNPVCYLTQHLKNQIENNFDKFSFSDFISSFNDIPKITKNLLAHYTGVLDYTNVDFETLIRHDESIPDKVKVLLYGFLIKPEKYVDSLKKYLYLYYNTLVKTDRNLKNLTLDSAILHSLLKSCFKDPEVFLSKIQDNKIRYSVCTTIPYHLQFGHTSFLWFILTEKSITLFHNDSLTFPSDYLTYLGDALRNQTRISIIQHLIHSQQISISELEQITNHATSTIQHHISILKKARLINEQKLGKQSFYSLNPEGLLYASKSLSDIVKEWNQNENLAQTPY